MGTFNEDVEVQEITVGKIDEGQKFVTTATDSQVSNNTTRAVWFSVPSGVPEDAFAVVDFTSTARARGLVATNVTQDGTGSETTVINAKPGAGSPLVTPRTGDAYTINGKQLTFIIPGGGVAGGAGGTLKAPTTFLLNPGQSMLYRITNVSGGTADIGVDVTWFEVDI